MTREASSAWEREPGPINVHEHAESRWFLVATSGRCCDSSYMPSYTAGPCSAGACAGPLGARVRNVAAGRAETGAGTTSGGCRTTGGSGQDDLLGGVRVQPVPVDRHAEPWTGRHWYAAVGADGVKVVGVVGQNGA